MRTFDEYIDKYFNTFPTHDLSPVVYGKNIERFKNGEYHLIPVELKLGLLFYIIKENKMLDNLVAVHFVKILNFIVLNEQSAMIPKGILNILPTTFVDNLFKHKAF